MIIDLPDDLVESIENYGRIAAGPEDYPGQHNIQLLNLIAYIGERLINVYAVHVETKRQLRAFVADYNKSSPP
jgi:hypothetical protein